MATPKPFKINVSDDLLDLTKKKLKLSRLPDQLANVEWEGHSLHHSPALTQVDGTPVAEVERLRNHWQNDYDWRKHEAEINQLPQFTLPVEVDDFGELTVHFVHKKSTSPDAIPLIFCHGWPGSFHEVRKILPLLTEPKDGEQAFHVVAPR
jgi:hypothetical protein